MFKIILALCFCCAANLVAQDTLATVTANITGPEINDEWFDECFGCDCSLGCDVGWEVSASSALKPEAGNSYEVGNLDDLRAKTAWIEGHADYGIGEYILYKFPKRLFVGLDSANWGGFIIMNGYFKSEKIWAANSRVKTFKMYHNDKPVCYVKLHDSMSGQDVKFAKPIYLKREDEIKLEIFEVYPGTKYKDTAISALILMGAH